MSRGPSLLLLATGAAAGSLAIVAGMHWLLPVPPWANNQPIGWTIYPQLGGLPQAIPPGGPTMEEYYSYQGFVCTAGIVGGLALGCWLAGLLLTRVRPCQEGASRWLRLAPPLLLVPCLIHVLGTVALVYKSGREADRLLEHMPAESAASAEALDEVAPPELPPDSLANTAE